MKIAFVGTSHLSINYGVAAAYKNFSITFFDFSISKISNLRNNLFSFYEPNFDKLYKKVQNKIEYSDKFEELKKFNLIFIAEDIETDDSNNSKYFSIKKIIRKVVKHSSDNACLVVLSQVEPGFTRKINWNKNNLYYQVETLIFGDAIKRALYPEQIIIGKDDQRTRINKYYAKFLKSFDTSIKEMNYETAELSKISINIFLISSITFANSLNSFSKFIGADWDMIKNVLKTDKRIGKYSYLNPGLGILSGNLMRDLNTLKKVSPKKALSKQYSVFLNSLSNKSKKWVENLILANSLNKISIFGFTYKENISTLKNSPALEIIKKFKKKQFLIFDPKVKSIEVNSKNYVISKNFDDFIKNSQNLIILTPWNGFLKKHKSFIKKYFTGKLIIDPYGMLKDDFKFSKKLKYFYL